MATGKKTGGKDFAKGNPGRPKGSVTLPKEIKELNRRKVEVLISKYMAMNLSSLQAKFKDKKTSSIDLMIIKIITECIKRGDYVRFNFLLERTIGTVNRFASLSDVSEDQSATTVIVIPSNNREG